VGKPIHRGSVSRLFILAESRYGRNRELVNLREDGRPMMRVAFEHETPTLQLPTLTQVFEVVEPTASIETAESTVPNRAEWAWQAAMAAVDALLKQMVLPTAEFRDAQMASQVCDLQGLLISGPTPVFSDVALLAHFKHWVLTTVGSRAAGLQLPPGHGYTEPISPLPTLSSLMDVPLVGEQFCLVQTPWFCWVAVLGLNAAGAHQFQFSFEPTTVEQIWQVLQARVQPAQSRSRHVVDEWGQLQQWRQRFPVVVPDYRIPMQFSRELLRTAPRSASVAPVPSTHYQCQAQAASARSQTVSPTSPIPSAFKDSTPSKQPDVTSPRTVAPEAEDLDVELLKVLAHEVRTPLATIQTLTRLLLKRSDLPHEVTKRLEAIQGECSGQINRFGLIFRAMELIHNACQTMPTRLTPLSLSELFEANQARWQTHAARRNLTLNITVPQTLPVIAIRDPHLLDQVLTGLLEYLGYSLPAGGQIHLQVALAGPQLKLEFKTRSDPQAEVMAESPILRTVGQLLMFQPETGGLSLSLPATKQLFQALGGKLTVRKQRQEEVLTIFLPLGTESDAY
jgi:signal transduction histidine kinase